MAGGGGSVGQEEPKTGRIVNFVLGSFGLDCVFLTEDMSGSNFTHNYRRPYDKSVFFWGGGVRLSILLPPQFSFDSLPVVYVVMNLHIL